MRPIFLISLPRAGSTLLQRLLMKHPAIASKSEPWIMLPLLYMLKPEGMITEYNHRDAFRATRDFIDALPGKYEDYNQALHNFAMTLFKGQCTPQHTFFLDKTPRYYLIIKELASIFPEAKFIFLVRNPLQIISSIISSFSNNTLKHLHFYHVDILKGFDKMAEGITALSDRSIVVQYNDLVMNPTATLDRIFNYLDLRWNASLITSLDDKGLDGSLGDKWGTKEYKAIETTSIDKWKIVLNENVRKRHIQKLIEGINEQTLSIHGYKKEELLKQLKDVKTKTTLASLTDLNHIISSVVIKKLYLNLFRSKVKRWSKDVIVS